MPGHNRLRLHETGESFRSLQQLGQQCPEELKDETEEAPRVMDQGR